MNTQFPLAVELKKIALTNKMTVTDAGGNVLVFAHQKLLKFKEQILLYADTAKTLPIGEIRADKVIDFSPTFLYQDQNGVARSSVKRNGSRSILKADYDILNSDGQPIYKVREDNGWIKLLDGLIGQVAIVGIFTGYFLNPKYNVNNLQGERVAQVVKQPAFFESSYTVELSKTDDPNLDLLPVALLSVLSRERMRG